MPLNQHVKHFLYLNQLQLVCNFSSRVIITLSYWYLSNFVLLLNRVTNWLIIQISSSNFDVVVLNFNNRKEIFFEGINRNLITCCFIISKNKQSFNSLITWIKPFSYMFFCISCSYLYYFIANYLVFVPINRSFKSFV